MSRVIAFAVCVAIGLSPTAASAQSFSLLAAFERGPRLPTARLLQVADGVFYGVSEQGGARPSMEGYSRWRCRASSPLCTRSRRLAIRAKSPTR